MRLYLELARRAFQQQFAYRGATLAGIFTNGVFGIMIASVFLAFYASQDDAGRAVEGWTKDQTITLVWINQSLLMTVYLWGWWEVMRSIQTGAIATDLLKPYDYFTHWMARDMGRAGAHLFIRGAPTFLTGYLLFDLLLPDSATRAVGFAVSVALAVMVSFCLRFMVNLAGFWVLDFRGVAMMFMAVTNVFSGMLAPIAFLPGVMRELASVLPFRAIIMTPNEVYLGQVEIWEGLALQAGWIVALVLGTRLLMRRCERKLVVQGG